MRIPPWDGPQKPPQLWFWRSTAGRAEGFKNTQGLVKVKISNKLLFLSLSSVEVSRERAHQTLKGLYGRNQEVRSEERWNISEGITQEETIEICEDTQEGRDKQEIQQEDRDQQKIQQEIDEIDKGIEGIEEGSH